MVDVFHLIVPKIETSQPNDPRAQRERQPCIFAQETFLRLGSFRLLFSCRPRERFYGRCFASRQTDYEEGLGRFVLRWNVVVVDVQQEQTKEKNPKTQQKKERAQSFAKGHCDF